MVTRTWVHRVVYHACRAVLLGPMMAWMRVRYFNVPDVRQMDGGLLIASNHQSFFDPPLVGVGLPKAVCFLARRDLFRVPGVGALLRAVGSFPVTRGAVDVAALKTVLHLLRNGEAMVMFPEGTRTRDGSLGQFKSGVAAIAIRCRVPVLPVCVEGTFACWPRSRALPRPGRVAVAYGPLLHPGGKSAEELNRLLYSEVAKLQEFLRDYMGYTQG